MQLFFISSVSFNYFQKNKKTEMKLNLNQNNKK